MKFYIVLALAAVACANPVPPAHAEAKAAISARLSEMGISKDVQDKLAEIAKDPKLTTPEEKEKAVDAFKATQPKEVQDALDKIKEHIKAKEAELLAVFDNKQNLVDEFKAIIMKDESREEKEKEIAAFVAKQDKTIQDNFAAAKAKMDGELKKLVEQNENTEQH